MGDGQAKGLGGREPWPNHRSPEGDILPETGSLETAPTTTQIPTNR